MRTLSTPPEQVRDWYDSVWCAWYAALWAEAAALSGRPDAPDRARVLSAGNPIATAILDRTAALGDPDRLSAAVFSGAGCRYRTPARWS